MTSTDTAETELPDRTRTQAWPYALAAITYLVSPFVIGTLLPSNTATTVLLLLLTAGALLLGVVDALVFRPTWAFPILTGIFAFVGLLIYTTSGTWIYAIGVALLCRLGGMVGRLRHAGA